MFYPTRITFGKLVSLAGIPSATIQRSRALLAWALAGTAVLLQLGSLPS